MSDRPAADHPFRVEEGAGRVYYVCRENRGRSGECVDRLGEFVFLECLLDVPVGVYVPSRTVKGRLGDNDFRPKRSVNELPRWVQSHIELDRGKGSRIRPDAGAAEPKSGRS